MFSSITNLFVPPACAVCTRRLDAGEQDLCAPCSSLWPGVSFEGPAPLTSRQAAAWYDGDIRSAIHALKFEGEAWRGPALGRALARTLAPAVAFDLVLPVPLSAPRLRERGYTQAARIVAGVTSVLRRPGTTRRLSRQRHGGPQHTRDREARAQIRGAYTARGVTGLRVLVVDDVTTTGETLAACAEALFAAGASEVHAWSLSATPRHRGDGGAPKSLLDALAPALVPSRDLEAIPRVRTPPPGP
jgi:ComF family protein